MIDKSAVIRPFIPVGGARNDPMNERHGSSGDGEGILVSRKVGRAVVGFLKGERDGRD